MGFIVSTQIRLLSLENVLSEKIFTKLLVPFPHFPNQKTETTKEFNNSSNVMHLVKKKKIELEVIPPGFSMVFQRHATQSDTSNPVT